MLKNQPIHVEERLVLFDNKKAETSPNSATQECKSYPEVELFFHKKEGKNYPKKRFGMI
jgi:hypothetical protein